ncbi:6-phospho-beta-glucosidase [Streptosporangium sp. NPDC000396]|uniref:family 4 glycosyl hydrolase n=1 Tax=Streptosporangium sp. NPDC000396 TaxID=3366185 RepID=UPI0036893B54
MGNNKLALVGGGGVRGPLFVESAARRAEELGLEEIVLFDIDEEKLRLLGGISAHLARHHSDVHVVATTDPRQALEGADFVVTTVRVGGDAARVTDERIAQCHGVLGQETTGPGGFAMAMRSVPAILGYAELLAELSPHAWLFNFTNPAGLVTQALRDAGHDRAVGICDSANLAQHAVAAAHGVDPNDLRPEVFGLNHLSWVRAVRDRQGRDLLAPLLADPGFRAATLQRFFPPELVELLGTWTNEYLYYYYFAEQALASTSAEPTGRGQEVARRNADLLGELARIGPERPQDAVAAYRAYEAGRRSTYMRYAEPTTAPAGERTLGEGSEGYAAVALDLMAALTGGQARYCAVNVPSMGRLDGLEPSDVAEISVVVDADGVRPLPIGAVPEPQAGLMRQVKLFERLAVQAIASRSRGRAVQALMAHPLVLSYSRAAALVDDYLAAHSDHIGEWR